MKCEFLAEIVATDRIDLSLDEIREHLPFPNSQRIVLLSEAIRFDIEISEEEMEQRKARGAHLKSLETRQKRKKQLPKWLFEANKEIEENEMWILAERAAADAIDLTPDDIREHLLFSKRQRMILVSEVIWFDIKIIVQEAGEHETARASKNLMHHSSSWKARQKSLIKATRLALVTGEEILVEGWLMLKETRIVKEKSRSKTAEWFDLLKQLEAHKLRKEDRQ